MDNLDAETIDSLLKNYPEGWKYEVPKLDRLGRIVRSRRPISLTRNELIKISDWKAGRRNRERLPKQEDEDTVLNKTMKAFAKEKDKERIRYLVSPWHGGFGMDGVGIPVGSAILRFIFPDKYGCVDWRNWYVLSQEKNELGRKNELFDIPPLPTLRNPYSSIGIRIDSYCNYLSIIRELAKNHPQRSKHEGEVLIITELVKEFSKRTPAEIDMALFSYSWGFIVKPRA